MSLLAPIPRFKKILVIFGCLAAALIAAYGVVTYRGLVAMHAVGPLQLQVASPTDDTATFFLVGDTGMGNAAQFAVASAMEQRCLHDGKPDGLILLGDNFYQKGVKSPKSDEFEKKFVKPYGGPCLGQVDVYPILGNHDHKGDPDAQVIYSTLNPRWRMPGRMYTFIVGNLIQFFALDTSSLDLFIPTWGGFRGEIDRALDDSQATWRIGLGHHPFASGCSDRPYREDPIRGHGISSLLCGRVNAYVSGHIHHLEHVIDPGACPTHSFISGGGGGELRPLDGGRCRNISAFGESTHGFLVLQAKPDLLTWEFIDSRGTSLYRHQQKHVPNFSSTPP